jgi:hypothetical protein
MKRGAIFMGGAFGLVALLWLVVFPSTYALHVAPTSPVFGIIDLSATSGLTTAPRLLTSVALLAAPETRRTVQTQLEKTCQTSAGKIEFGFQPDFRALEIIPENERAARPPTKVLPSAAMLQLSNTPHGYLLVRAEPGKNLLTTLAPRRWLGTSLREIISQATAATVVLGESDDHQQAILTLALEFATSDQAEAALNLITSKQGDFDALGFVAQPGAHTLTRQSKAVVIRVALAREVITEAVRTR